MHTVSNTSLSSAAELPGLRATAPETLSGSALTADPLGLAGVRMTYARNEEIFGEAEPAACVYRLISGVVRTHRILADGRRQITEFYLPGDVFGLQEGANHSTSAEAVTDCTVVALRRNVLAERATQDACIAHKMCALALHHLHRSEEHMLVLGRKTACERVAWFLMDMAERIPAHDRVELPISRQDIADFLGLTIETVSRSMTQLQDEGVIALPTCRQVLLTNRQALLDLAA